LALRSQKTFQHVYTRATYFDLAPRRKKYVLKDVTPNMIHLVGDLPSQMTVGDLPSKTKVPNWSQKTFQHVYIRAADFDLAPRRRRFVLENVTKNMIHLVDGLPSRMAVGDLPSETKVPNWSQRTYQHVYARAADFDLAPRRRRFVLENVTENMVHPVDGISSRMVVRDLRSQTTIPKIAKQFVISFDSAATVRLHVSKTAKVLAALSKTNMKRKMKRLDQMKFMPWHPRVWA